MILWDSLFLLLVAFPVLTGGVWWNAPHFHVQYTEAGPAAAVLALWLWRRGGAERSHVCRLGARAWSAWKAGVERNPALYLGVAWLSVSAIWFTTSFLRHRALGSGLADLGIFTNAIHNVATLGWPMSSLKGGLSLLADHQIFLLYPLGWIFRFWPSPVFLLLLQAPLFASGGVALYHLGRQRLGASHPVVPWLPFLYWAAGPLRAANRFDFHPEIFMLPFFLFAAWLLQEQRWSRRGLGALALLLAFASKESAGPVACGFGLAWALGAGPEATRGFTRRLGVALIALGAAVFAFDQRYVPSLFGATYAYSNLYEPLPASPLGLALAPFTQPAIFFGRLLSWSRIRFFCGSLLSSAFLPLLSPASAIAAIPGFLMLFLTNGDHRISLGYHYAIEPMAGLLFALPAALDSGVARRLRPALLPILLVAGAATYGHSETYFWRVYQPGPRETFFRQEILPHVPTDRSIAASYAFVPQLAARRWVNQPVSLSDERGRSVDCILIDPKVNNSGMSNEELALVVSKARESGWVRELWCGSFQLLQRKDGLECLDAPPPICPDL